MSYTLYGSQTSPFVRRLRLLMEKIPCEFRELNIFEAQDATLLNKINPLNQVPVLVHNEKTIWDSRQIFRYLNETQKFETLNWEDENLLTAIEGMMDAGIALLMMKRSGMNVEENYMYVVRQRDRIESVLDYLSPYMKDQGLREWRFATMSLYAFLDWANFRQIIDLSQKPLCQSFLEAHAKNSAVISTAIPKG